MPRNDDVRFTTRASLKLPPPPPHLLTGIQNSLSRLINSLTNRSAESTRSPTHLPEFLLPLCSASLSLSRSRVPKSPLLCSATLSVTRSGGEESTQSAQPPQKAHLSGRNDEERVLISEVLVRNKDGDELERKDLEAEAMAALKACRANSALTVREVQEDVHRIIGSGYFCSCMPIAVDTRDGIRLVFQVSDELSEILFQSLSSF